MAGADRGALHHVELYVHDLGRSRRFWAWLLGELGWSPGAEWSEGFTWRLGHSRTLPTCPVPPRITTRTPCVTRIADEPGRGTVVFDCVGPPRAVAYDFGPKHLTVEGTLRFSGCPFPEAEG